MELYSKRYNGGARRLNRLRRLGDDADNKLISDPLRNRLLHQFQYLVQSNDYLEQFLIVHDQNTDKFYLHDITLRQLSLRELGYDLTTLISCDKLDFNTTSIDDAKFFDLIELAIVFTKDDKRSEVSRRINIIFHEEEPSLSIHGHMIIDNSDTGLRSITALIKNPLLKNKLNEFYEINRLKPDYQSLARISADILQILFSSPKSQSDTKVYSESICKEIAKKWTNAENTQSLKTLLSDTIKNAKLLNNQIENIRHTDKSSIPVDHPNFYKLIAMENISIAELVILSLPEKYIMNEDPSKMKKEYLSKYKLKSGTGWFIKKKITNDSIIKPEDLPF